MRQPSGKQILSPSPVLISLGITAAIVAAGVSLWRVTPLHPYIIGLGAGMAALLAPLPGLVRPQTKGKWQLAVAIAAVVGVGVWFGANKMAAAKEVAELRMETQRQSVQMALATLPRVARDAFILSVTRSMKRQYRERQFVSVLDLSRIIQELDESNGHALYYAGEAFRCLRNRTDMRGVLQRYLAEATQRADSVDGAAAQCYQRPHGYCGERTEWINHLMANDYLADADTAPQGRRTDLLLTAYKYERHVLETRSLGFYGLDTIKSSCELLQDVRARLRSLKQQAPNIDRDIESLRCETSKI